MTTDKRRYGVIEVRFHPGPPTYYVLSIDGQHWAAVEWSPSRHTWCIEDAAGHCLAHCEHIQGDHIDRPTAIALAKRMILDGRMPTPEEAERRLQERRRQERQKLQERRPQERQATQEPQDTHPADDLAPILRR